MPFTLLIFIGFALAIIITVMGGRKQRALEGIRANWGRPRKRTRKIERLAEAHRSRVSELGATGLDDRTWNDLHMDDVFAAVDRTESTLGQQALYHRLRTAPVADSLDAFEALITLATEKAPLRERAQLALERLQEPHGYDLWWLARKDAIQTESWYAIFPVLALITISLLITTVLRPASWPMLVLILAVNVVTRLSTDRRIGAEAVAFRQLAPIIATAQALQFLSGEDIAPITAPLVADTPRIAPLKTISRWVSGDPFMLATSPNMLAVTLSDGVNAVYEYFNLAFLLDANGVFFGAATLRKHGQALLRVISAIGDVDAAIGIASFRAEREDWTRPEFLAPGQPAVIAEAKHPLIPDAVPNSITLPASKGVLVTGSNMSGKTTFLRTIGVNAVLAQTIHTCLAATYNAPIFRVRTCIGRADDLLSGKSYYIVEVEALLELVSASLDATPYLFLLDELFRGTNAVERIAAGQSVLIELLAGAHAGKPHVVIAATHDGELVEMLAGLYVPCHFGDAVVDDGLTFDHRLRPGRATSRNAIALLRLHGAPVELIDRALKSAADLDKRRIY